MYTISRRSLLKASAVVGGAAAVPTLLKAGSARAAGEPVPAFGPLSPKPSENTGEELLALPDGFKYTAFGRTGEIMNDGVATPGVHDGMGAFAYQNGSLIRLIRNHEVGTRGTAAGNLALAYDVEAKGGCTCLTIDPLTRLPTETFLVLGGTVRNCAGGPTPWGTWITCEETNAKFTVQHGYLFEVPSDATGQVAPKRLTNAGLVYPEAAAIDPATGYLYITMDLDPGGIFRFLPDIPGVLDGPGRLQMLGVANQPQYDTRTGQPAGVKLPMVWFDITTPTDEAAYRSNLRVAYNEGLALGGATFDRPEGMWYDGLRSIFFDCTSGGDAGLGQVWAIRLGRGDQQRLDLIYESTDAAVLENPDNLTITPGGRWIVLCEDGDGDQFVRVLRRNGGAIYDLVRNNVNDAEFAGACFSPDARTMFVNLQSPGITFAIWRADGAALG